MTASEEIRRHTILLRVENRSGVLAKIAGLIAARGYNIESLCVAQTHDPTLSSMTLVVHGDEWVIEQAAKQLERLIDVVEVQDLTSEAFVERELILMRIKSPPETRTEIMGVCAIFRGRVVDISPATCTLELTGTADKIDAFMEMMKHFEIEELHRTGQIAMPRAKRIKDPQARTTP